MHDRTEACPRPTVEPGCRPWCALHQQETDTCSSVAIDVGPVHGMSAWLSQSPGDPAPAVVVDGHGHGGAPFDLVLTPDQASEAGDVLRALVLLGSAA